MLPYAMELFYKLSIDANGRCGELEPNDSMSLPCEVVYTEPHQILFKPRDGGSASVSCLLVLFSTALFLPFFCVYTANTMSTQFTVQ